MTTACTKQLREKKATSTWQMRVTHINEPALGHGGYTVMADEVQMHQQITACRPSVVHYLFL